MADKVEAKPPERATGASLAVIVLTSVCFGALALLHILRTDLDPVREVMSGYANGRFGAYMTAAFYLFGLAAMALAWRLRRALRGNRGAVAVPILLSLAGLCLLLAGVFEVERPVVPDTIEEVIHSDAALAGFALMITAMLVFAVVIRSDARWVGFRGRAMWLAISAAVAGAASPFADKTPWSGIAQRVLGLVVVLWLLLTALHVRSSVYAYAQETGAPRIGHHADGLVPPRLRRASPDQRDQCRCAPRAAQQSRTRWRSPERVRQR